MNDHRTLRCVIYSRVSTQGQVDNSSLYTQREACLKFALEQGWEVIAVHEDAGYSGALYYDRPEFQAAIATVEAGEADVLLSYRVDRASRSLQNTLDVVRRLQRANGYLAFCDVGLLENTSSARMMLSVTGAIADFEKSQIAERVQRGMRAMVAQGKMPTSTRIVYGYHVVSLDDISQGLYPPEDQGRIYMAEDEARWVQEIFRHYAQHGNLSLLGRYLKANGVQPPGTRKQCHGKQQATSDYWYNGTLRRILSHEAYIGRYPWGKYENVLEEGRPNQNDANKTLSPIYQRERPKDQWTYIPCPAIVDEELWQYCQMRLAQSADDKRAQSANTPDARLLSGLVFCPSCGGRQVLWRATERRNADGTPYRYYHCKNKLCPQDWGPGYYTRMNADRLERMVLVALKTLAQHPDVIQAAIRNGHVENVRLHHAEVEERRCLVSQQKKLAEQAKAVVRLQMEAVLKGLSVTSYDAVLKEIQQNQNAVDERLSVIGKPGKRAGARTPEESAREMQQQLTRVVENLLLPDEEFPPVEKRQMLQTLLERVEPTDDGLELQFRNDTVTYVLDEGGEPDFMDSKLYVKVGGDPDGVYPIDLRRIHSLPLSSVAVRVFPR